MSAYLEPLYVLMLTAVWQGVLRTEHRVFAALFHRYLAWWSLYRTVVAIMLTGKRYQGGDLSNPSLIIRPLEFRALEWREGYGRNRGGERSGAVDYPP